MKILLDYDSASGEIKDPSNGSVIYSWVGLDHLKHDDSQRDPNQKESASELKDLKSAGFEAGEIIQMQKAGLV